MGGNESKEDNDGSNTVTEMTEDMQEALKANTYYPGNASKYPYFLVQLSEDGELAFGDSDILISDCIAAYCATNRVTHLILQTHGWNTTAQKAIAVPFTEFMGGMQNDAAMPTDEEDKPFKPVFVAFIWPAVPYDFFEEQDALTRTELLMNSEKQNTKSGDTDILRAAEAAKAAIENETGEEDEALKEKMKELAESSVPDDDDEDEQEDDVVAVQNGDSDSVVSRAKETALSDVIEGICSVFTPILRPLENLAFSRLMKRGRSCGAMMGRIAAKFMKSAMAGEFEQKPLLTMMANSLGAHMLVGALSVSHEMPYKPHALFFVQGAIAKQWFGSGRRYSQYAGKVAGPIICTYSERDYLLKNVFGPFHGDALGFEGFPHGCALNMKCLEEMQEEPYVFENGVFNSVNCSK